MALPPVLEMAARRTVGRLLGPAVRRAKLPTTPGQRAVLLAQLGIDTVLDVGANIGQYAAQLRLYGFTGTIHSYEPLASAHARLATRAAADPRWHTHPLGLARSQGHAILHVSQNSQSSSLLAMLPRHLEGAPESAVVGEERVELTTLAAALAELGAPRYAFVKIDAQGSERAILEGAGPGLDGVAGLELELALVPLYDGETLFGDMVSWLATRSFELRWVGQGLVDHRTGAVLQVDALFARAS